MPQTPLKKKKEKNMARKRDIVKKIRVTEEEERLIKEKMLLIPTTNFNSYAVKMLIDGYVIKYDFKEIKNLTGQIGKIGSNINQVAKRANESRTVSQTDIKDLLKSLHDIQVLLNRKIGKLIK